jgi:hypothetical protein
VGLVKNQRPYYCLHESDPSVLIGFGLASQDGNAEASTAKAIRKIKRQPMGIERTLMFRGLFYRDPLKLGPTTYFLEEEVNSRKVRLVWDRPSFDHCPAKLRRKHCSEAARDKSLPRAFLIIDPCSNKKLSFDRMLPTGREPGSLTLVHQE